MISVDSLFKRHPLAITCALGGFAIAIWLFDSVLVNLLGLLLGAGLGAAIDAKKQ